MKKISIIFFLLSALAIQARQVYTIKSGNWEADSVWYNNLKPDTVGDTISIFHHISLNSDIVLSTGSYLIIDSTGWLCGDQSMLLTGWANFLSRGFLGLYYLEIYYAFGVNLAPGIIDMGEGGMYSHGIGSHFLNSRGCMQVHAGRQPCLFPCVPDTFLSFTANYNVVHFVTHQQPFSYSYDFGDGTTLNTSEHQVTHSYSDSGEFEMRLIISSCCGSETVYRKIHIELPPPLPPPPPPCMDYNSFFIYPNPTTTGFWITKEFCEDEDVHVKIFSVTGQLVATHFFSTVDKVFKEYISSYFLSAATYIVDIQSPSKKQKLKLVLVDNY
ncbi:MAG: PKD domain-containing protein [Bacteroidota bacterium]